MYLFFINSQKSSCRSRDLTQVIGTIFQRVEESVKNKSKRNSTPRLTSSSSDDNLEIQASDETENQEKLTLKRLENLNDVINDNDRLNEANFATETDEDLAVKDAFWYFEQCASFQSSH